MTKKWFPCLILCLGFSALLGGCALPGLNNRSVSVALPVAEARNTRLGAAIAPQLAEHNDESGLRPLGNPLEAFAARMLLANAAERTLDVQYYIWQGDVTGLLLLDTLSEAAERGVRVRLLLDDHGTAGLDKELAALAAQTNIEVRLFNPFRFRKAKWLGYVTHFKRANRRMHNKSFTADNSATIIGGRNIADDYFGATTGILRQDLDVLAFGPVVHEVSADFDRYWASPSAYPVEAIVRPYKKAHARRTANGSRGPDIDAQRNTYFETVRNTTFVRDLLAGELLLEWAPTVMISDDPAKGIGEAADEDLLIRQLDEMLGQPDRTMVLVSPYFVPTRAGVDAFVTLARRGVLVRILTNALEATDVLPVHAGYAKRRKELLKAGVRLFELRHLSTPTVRHKSAGPFGSSASSLHAKTMTVDHERVFIGSFNFDPRSMHLNTELGFVIESPEMAQEFEEEFDALTPMTAYEVKLDERGKLYWVEQQGTETIRYDKEPGSTLGRRIALRILTVLPIEWLL